MACRIFARAVACALLSHVATAQTSSSTDTRTLTESQTAEQTTSETTTWTGDFDDPYFIGYWVKSDEGTSAPYETLRITAYTSWITSGTYAGDCAESDEPCALATACTTSGSAVKLLSADGLSSECDPYHEQQCHTLTIYASSPDAGPTAYNIACREEEWNMNTLYQTSPTYSSEDNSPTDRDNPLSGNGTGGVSTSSPMKLIIIIIAVLAGALIICFFIWLPLHRRNKRKEKERESQMEISTFAQSRGYNNPEDVRAGQGELTVSGSTVAETRNATAGDTVASSTVYLGEERSQVGGR